MTPIPARARRGGKGDMMIQAILTNQTGLRKITISLREDTVVGMTLTVTKQTDIEDRVQPASVRVYTWQGPPDNLIELHALIDMGLFISQELDQYILTPQDFDKPWSVYRTGVYGQTWRIEERVTEGRIER